MKRKLLIESIKRKITEMLNETEDRLAFLKKSFPDVPLEMFDMISKLDPTAKVVEGNIIRAGIYTQWILLRYRKISAASKSRFPEDIHRIVEALKLYHKYKNKLEVNYKNIFNIDSFTELLKLTEPFHKLENQSIETEKNKKELRIIYDDPTLTLMQPLTKEASIQNFHYPITSWCTATAGDYNHFESYNKQGPLYVVKLKTRAENNLYQFHFQTGQFMDSDNVSIELSEFFKENPTVKNPLYTEIEKTNDLKSMLLIDPEKTINNNPSQLQELIKNIRCDTGNIFIISLLYKHKKLTTFNCPSFYISKRGVCFVYDISDVIYKIFSNHDFKKAEHILNGDINDSMESYESTSEILNFILNSIRLNKESLDKIKLKMEKDGYETSTESDILEDLKNNPDNYPVTVDMLSCAYRDALSTEVYGLSKSRLNDVISNYFDGAKIIGDSIHLDLTDAEFFKRTHKAFTEFAYPWNNSHTINHFRTTEILSQISEESGLCKLDLDRIDPSVGSNEINDAIRNL
jgi:hypothetical protein